MSAGDFIKDAGPIAIGLGGLLVAYANSRQPGREARHHARVETLYQDMLDTLQHRFNEVMERHGLGIPNVLAVRDPSTYQVTRARIRLYASGSVTASWDLVHNQLTMLWLDVIDGQVQATPQQLDAIESMIDELSELMRRDLGVPDVPLSKRAWSWVGYGWRVAHGRARKRINAVKERRSLLD